MFLPLSQPASAGVITSCYRKIKESIPAWSISTSLLWEEWWQCGWFITMCYLVAHLAIWFERQEHKDRKQAEGEGRRFRKRGTWIVKWWDTYEHQLKKPHISTYGNEKIYGKTQSGRTDLTWLIKSMPTLPPPFLPSHTCYAVSTCQQNKIIYLEDCLPISLFPASTKYERSCWKIQEKGRQVAWHSTKFASVFWQSLFRHSPCRPITPKYFTGKGSSKELVGIYKSSY